jgi:monoamine oxidase
MSSHHDVIVVGAGLAGLRCAGDLVAAGRDPLVLDARQRVGGRVFSHRFSDGQWCERGAEFVDAAHVEVLGLAARLGLATSGVPSGRDDDARWLDAGGRALPFSVHSSLASDLARWEAMLQVLSERVDLDRLLSTDAHAPGDPQALGDLDVAPLDELLLGLGLGVMARVVIGRDIRTEYMVGPREVSQLMAAWMTALHRRSGDGFEGYRISGGNDQLATGLAAAIDGRVRLGTRVVWVEPDVGAVTLASGERLTADHLVVTVPLPVLSRLWTDMPAALSSVGYGVGGKVSMQVRRRIWHDYGCDGSVRTDRSWGEVWDTSDGQVGDRGVLTALVSSHDGAAMLGLPETPDRIVAEMERLFPGFAGLVDERVLTDWTSDACSLGAYATFGPGELLAAAPLLRRPYGRMLLAGEHTDGWAGYMEGALRSGARVAHLILNPPPT